MSDGECEPREQEHQAEWPPVEELYPASLCRGVHPACLSIPELLSECSLRTQRRSGPGGQHRNKTSSGVFLEHGPSGQIGEATERRSQADNRGIATERLRLKLAITLRGPDSEEPQPHQLLRQKYAGGNLRISVRNLDFAAVLAVLLNDLWRAGGQPSLVASKWKVSTSAITRFLKQSRPALVMTNAYRDHHGRGPLH